MQIYNMGNILIKINWNTYIKVWNIKVQCKIFESVQRNGWWLVTKYTMYLILSRTGVDDVDVFNRFIFNLTSSSTGRLFQPSNVVWWLQGSNWFHCCYFPHLQMTSFLMSVTINNIKQVWPGPSVGIMWRNNEPLTLSAPPDRRRELCCLLWEMFGQRMEKVESPLQLSVHW